MIIEIRTDYLSSRYKTTLEAYDEQEEKNLKELPLFKKIEILRERKEIYWSELTDEQIEEQVKSLIDLYHKIKNNGCKEKPHPIINIDENGLWRLKS